MLTITACRTYPDPPPSLLKLARLLQKQHGISVKFDIWQNRPAAPFVLPLCAWDYAAEPQAFAAWLQETEKAGSRFANPPALIRWNMHKSYLPGLAAEGTTVIPTAVLPAEARLIVQTMRQNGWHEAVLKPAVGQSGRHVVRIRAGRPLPDLHPYRHGAVLQPFIRSVENKGEISLVFFNGRFSHAVCRRPAVNEWRANSAYGATVLPAAPPDYALAAAARTLSTLPEIPVYARVDGIPVEGRFLLGELELIEPALYLDTAPGTAERFAGILADWINQKETASRITGGCTADKAVF